ncbi:hypothetical protein EX30DRAFT_200281 [Ascodesmis nigricans]|uniref:Uncharacterized protein n=1 Tax=Ascodesmis nigricans TaxID=341454 RepID=A0A4S2MKR6_9PEZI|nr:hypothetical protein EX30DRAFT_200281 [Ascodesmis nigricans]
MAFPSVHQSDGLPTSSLQTMMSRMTLNPTPPDSECLFPSYRQQAFPRGLHPTPPHSDHHFGLSQQRALPQSLQPTSLHRRNSRYRPYPPPSDIKPRRRRTYINSRIPRIRKNSTSANTYTGFRIPSTQPPKSSVYTGIQLPSDPRASIITFDIPDSNPQILHQQPPISHSQFNSVNPPRSKTRRGNHEYQCQYQYQYNLPPPFGLAPLEPAPGQYYLPSSIPFTRGRTPPAPSHSVIPHEPKRRWTNPFLKQAFRCMESEEKVVRILGWLADVMVAVGGSVRREKREQGGMVCMGRPRGTKRGFSVFQDEE